MCGFFIWKFTWKTAKDFSKRNNYNGKYYIVKILQEVISIDKSSLISRHLNGIYEELAGLVGIESVIKIYSTFKGQQVNFPVRLFSHEYVVSQIVELYNGTNTNTLATKFGYSERWVREIIKKHIEESDKGG